MKTKYLITMLLVIAFIFIIPKTTIAETNESFVTKSVDNDSYGLHFKIYNGFTDPSDHNAYIGIEIRKYVLGVGVAYKNGSTVYGTYEWENPDYVIKDGKQTVTLLFKSDAGDVVKAELELYGIEWVNPNADGPGEPVRDPVTEDQTTDPTLTAATIIMNKDNTYDINVNDKVAGTYIWSSSNDKVAKVNAKNGFVTALSDGNAKITCKITTPDEQTYELVSDVVVGTDDNFPVLTDNVLDLSITNQYDLGVENQIAKSKYRYKSSNRSIATVNASNGIVTAIGEGKANIYCTITTPDKQIIILKCEVNITK